MKNTVPALLTADAAEKGTPVAAQILRRAAETPEAPAIIANDSVTSFSQLARHIASVSAWLRSVGITAGDRVVVQARPDALCIACFYAVQTIGAVLVPVEKTAAPARIGQIAAETCAKLIVAFSKSDEFGVSVTTYETLAKLPFAEPVDVFAVAALPPDEPCEMIFTTGTTGKSKGVLISHRAMAWYVYAVAKRVDLKPGTRFLLTTPLNHAGGLRRTHLMLANGCCMVYMDGMSDIKGYFATIEQHGVNALYLPPVSVRILLSLTGKMLSRFADRIDFVYSSSSTLPEGDCVKLAGLLPHTRLYNAYEASETPGVSAYNYNVPEMLSGCLGDANDGVTLAVLDETGTITAAPGAKGRVCVKSPMNMLRYDGEPELTASVYRDGWFVSGDIGELDSQGCLYYHGREGDVINIGGFKIAPTEVEEAALAAGGVRECICIREKDGFGVAYLKLLVVPDGELNATGIADYISAHLEAYKLPRKIEQTDAIRKTFNGKIDRKSYRT